MIIAVNTQLLLKDKLEGLGWFSHETLKRITTQHPEHKFVFIFDRKWDDEFIYNSNITPVKTIIPSRHAVLWYLRFEKIIPKILKKHKADLFLSTDGWMSLNTDVRTLDVIHDINFIHNPSNFPLITLKYCEHFFPKFAKKATRLASVSEYSKKDISRTWDINPNKIDVIYNGSNEIYKPLEDNEKQKIRKELTNNIPYFVYVGSINPRKNIDGMLKAFDLFKENSQMPHKLIIVGEKMWRGNYIKDVYENMKFKDDVVFTGRLSEEKLHKILGGAISLVLVSHLEGFGIPILEAMSCDVPVICSNITSMPEVAGEAAVYVNPKSIDSISKGFEKMAKDENHRNKLIEAAKIQRNKFSWDKSADNLWSSIEKTMK